MRLMTGMLAAAVLAACSAETREPPETPVEPEWQDRMLLEAGADATPGAFMIFLSSGKLVQGACANPYRVSEWENDGGSGVRWTEDGMEIAAVIEREGVGFRLDFTSDEGLRDVLLAPVDGERVCPDLPG